METVVTIIGKSLDPDWASRLIREVGINELQIDILQPDYAMDMLIKPEAIENAKIIYKKMTLLGDFDIFIQKNDEFRKKKLLMADMDATIVCDETLDEIADHFDLKQKVSEITAQSMRGELDFEESVRKNVSLLKGLPVEALAEVRKKMRISPGAESLIKTMNKFGHRCVLVSGGFDFFTSYVGEKLGFHDNFGNRFVIEDEKLTGDVHSPVLDKETKERLLLEQAKELSCDLKHVMAVGDGANDIAMLKKAGTGVGYFGKPAVLEATPYQIRHTDLTSLLYMQGYRQSEIEEV